MKRKNSFRNRTASVAAAVMIAAASLAPSALRLVPLNANAGQQLGQTDFDEGIGLPWHIVESAPGEMDFEIDNGVYSVTIV